MPADRAGSGEVEVDSRDDALKEALQRERVNALELELQRDLLRDAQRQLAQLNAELEAFTYSASHDLAVPLRTISAFAALLREARKRFPIYVMQRISAAFRIFVKL